MRFFRNNEHPFQGWTLFSYYHTLPRSLWTSDTYLYFMDMTTSVHVLSRHLTYWMAFDDSTCSHRHYYYINLDVRCNFVLDGHGYFMSLCRVIYYYRVWLCMRTTSSFPYFYSLSLRWTWSLICCIWLSLYFQHSPWLRVVPSVGCLCVSIPWLLHGTSQITLPGELWWGNIQTCSLCCSRFLKFYYCQPDPSQKNRVYICA